MRIGLQTWGTEGDIRPFLALSAGLAAAGHQVTLAATEIRNGDYSHYGDRGGFRVMQPGHIDVTEEEFSNLGRRMVASFNPVLKSRLLIENFLNPAIPEMYSASKELCNQCDLVIGHLFVYPLKVAAEKAGIPWVPLYTTPLLPSSKVSPPGFPASGASLWWKSFDSALGMFWKPDMDTFFQKEGLRKPNSVLTDVFVSESLNLVCVSPSIYPVASTGNEYNFCGEFLLRDNLESLRNGVQPELEEFISRGESPVYITFGSMYYGEQHPGDLVEMLVGSVRRTGCRAIIQAAGGATAEVSPGEDVFFVERTQHRTVFPRCAAVVHHGGCGTSHSVCRAGVPSVVVAYTADQPLWGSLLEKAGVAPKMHYRRSLTERKLSDSLRKVLGNTAYRGRAQAVSQQMKRENGIDTAISLIEKTHGG